MRVSVELPSLHMTGSVAVEEVSFLHPVKGNTPRHSAKKERQKVKPNLLLLEGLWANFKNLIYVKCIRIQ